MANTCSDFFLVIIITAFWLGLRSSLRAATLPLPLSPPYRRGAGVAGVSWAVEVWLMYAVPDPCYPCPTGVAFLAYF